MLRLNDILDRIGEYHPGADLDLVRKAYVYSAKVHQGQVRKSGEPYLVHPIEVAGILTELKLDVPTVCTGLLHDTIEDTLATEEELEELFGREIAFLVDGVTKLSKLNFSSKEEQQAENFRKMLMAMAKDIRVLLVKLADRVHNMRTMEVMRPDKAERIASETIDIYAPLANRLGMAWIKTELEDLSFRYLKPHEYYNLSEKVARKRAERDGYVRDVIKILGDKLKSSSLTNCEVTGRGKHLYSVYRKMRRKNVELDQIYDLTAFRILTDDVRECYEVLGLIHGTWRPIPGRFKDYVAMPKPNLYQSLHTVVIGPYNEQVEFQIRTREMHAVAENGIAAHWQYKEGKPADAATQAQFNWLRQLMEWQDDFKDPTEFIETVKVDLFSDEVYVFTPNGDVKALPRGATPVDFAYCIHTEVGHRCVGAKVNGKLIPLKSKLKTGDIIEILTSQKGKPSKDWLNFVRTSKAKAKIRGVIKAELREKSEALGRELVTKELRKFKLNLNKAIKSGKIAEAATGLGFKNEEALFIAIGYGKCSAVQVARKCAPQDAEQQQQQEAPPKKDRGGMIGRLLKKVGPQSRSGVTVDGVDDVLVRYAKCCNPLPGDRIVGFVTRGRGVTVHEAHCQHVLESDPERRVELAWNETVKQTRPVALKVVTTDRPGVLAKLSQSFSDMGVNISQANCVTREDKQAVNTFHVGVTDNEQLKAVIRELEKINGVFSVSRVRG